MKKIIILMAVAWFSLNYLSSCKKDKTDPAPVEIKFAAEALSYVQLPVNKYFIYKDSASGNLDSVVVTESALKVIFVPKYDCPSNGGVFCLSTPAYTYQTFSLKLTNFTTSPNQSWYSESATSFILGNNGGLFIIATDSAYLSFYGSFWYPFLSNYFGSLQQASSIPSLIIEGKTYTNVIQFISSTTNDTNNPSYKHTIYYWAKGIGIIKREIRTSNTAKTESLVRHG